jgi:hypothetical protein
VPEQKKLAFWEIPWINEQLKTLLFCQPNNEQPQTQLRTYLILDAVKYTQIRGVCDLDLIDSPTIQCLYKGQAAHTHEKLAPYLVDMTLPDVQYDCLREEILETPNFHRDYFKKYWGQGAGIFIRTTATFAEVHTHFRKFTRSLDETTDTLMTYHRDGSALSKRILI